MVFGCFSTIFKTKKLFNKQKNPLQQNAKIDFCAQRYAEFYFCPNFVQIFCENYDKFRKAQNNYNAKSQAISRIFPILPNTSKRPSILSSPVIRSIEKGRP